MTKCAVLHCKNYSNRSKDISYHPFPSDPSRREEWVKAIRRDKFWIPSKHHKICSKHFEPQCYNKFAKLRKLNQNAVPTLDLPGSIVTNPDTVTRCINCMCTTEVKTERLDDPMSPASSWSEDGDKHSMNDKEKETTGTLATIAIDPLSPKHFSSPSDSEPIIPRQKNKSNTSLRKKLVKREEACKRHVQKIYLLLKANRRLCQQNKTLRKTLMNMKKKLTALGRNDGSSSNEEESSES